MIHHFDEKDRQFRSTHLTNGMEFVVTFSRLSITLICQLAVLVHVRMVIDVTEVVVMMIVIIRPYFTDLCKSHWSTGGH